MFLLASCPEADTLMTTIVAPGVGELSQCSSRLCDEVTRHLIAAAQIALGKWTRPTHDHDILRVVQMKSRRIALNMSAMVSAWT